MATFFFSRTFYKRQIFEKYIFVFFLLFFFISNICKKVESKKSQELEYLDFFHRDYSYFIFFL